PIDSLFGHFERLDAMDGFLDDGIIVLNTHRGAIETDFAQGNEVLACEFSGVDFHTGLDVLGESKSRTNHLAQAANFIRRRKCRCAATTMELVHFPLWIEVWFHQVHLPSE